MRLYLINPTNPLVSMTKIEKNRWNKYRVWKPLGLLVIAGLTPPDWEIKIIDENLGVPDYKSLPRPDIVGITAFTSQAERAYQVAAEFGNRDVPVVMGGIHATMCPDEALEQVDAVVMGEAESVWGLVLKDLKHGNMKRIYQGERLGMENVPLARHDLLEKGYKLGMIQTSRGCPLNCKFCSVTAFNGRVFRRRPIENIIEELKTIRERHVLIVDDNFFGTRSDHIEQTKELLWAMIKAKIKKKWMAQATVNMGEDEELVMLAARAGCVGVYIGFEACNSDGLRELRKEFNIRKEAVEFKNLVRLLQKHKVTVVGSFIMGLDTDKKGIGKQIAETGIFYGVDALNVQFLTPLPGTRLWADMESKGRIAANNFPEDWKFYTLNFPVARYKNLSWKELLIENEICHYTFYSYKNIMKRMLTHLCHMRRPLILLICNLSYRRNGVIFHQNGFEDLNLLRGELSSKLEYTSSISETVTLRTSGDMGS